MTNVVITGSTRGIGFGIAAEFLRRGHRVVISSRTDGACRRAVDQLRAAYPNGDVKGIACDVIDVAETKQLWNRATAYFGAIDIWINNAGRAHGTHRFWQQPAERIEEVIGTNLTGLMQASHVAINGMLEQGYGAIYNLGGFGRTGMRRAGMTIYGTSKRGVDYFTKSLAHELRGTGVIVGQMNPGMIVTDMLREGYETTVQDPETVRRTYNILADMPEDAAPYLVERMLTNKKNGVMINRRPRYRVIARLLAARFVKDREIFVPEPASANDRLENDS